MEPGAHRVEPAPSAGPAREQQKRRLEGVFRILAAAEHAPADPEDQAAVATHQTGKCLLIAVRREAREQFAIGRLGACGTAG